MEVTNMQMLAQEASVAADQVHELLASEKAEGYARPRSNHTAEALDAFVEILDRAGNGNHLAQFQLREAVGLPDFPNLFGDTIDRAVLAYYKAWIPAWQSFCNVGRPIKDFRAAKRFDIQGMQSVLTAVQEYGEYIERAPSDATPITLQVAKYGGRFGISFEALINDDMNALAELPQRLAVAARRTEAVAVAALYSGATGINTAVFKTANKNLALTSDFAFFSGNNPVLSIQSLGAAMQAMALQMDPDGHPIIIDAFTLVVPPALEVAANNIVNALQFVATGVDGGVSNENVWAKNWLTGRIQITVDPYITWTATSNKHTAWFLFSKPMGGNRPAIELDYLQGHDGPQLFQKMPNAQALGGGSVPESFEADKLEYKVRHIFATGVIDPKLAFASNGSGS